MADRKLSAVVILKGDGRFMTTHFDLAIYCHMLHRMGKIVMPVEEVVKVDWARHEFIFSDPDHRIRGIELDLANGPTVKLSDWTAAERSLKTVMQKRPA